VTLTGSRPNSLLSENEIVKTQRNNLWTLHPSTSRTPRRKCGAHIAIAPLFFKIRNVVLILKGDHK